MSSNKNPTRERILKSALSLLEAGGGSDVRMSDIAKTAKVSRQAVYLHFPNRLELLVATTRYLDESYGIEDKLISSRTAPTGVKRLAEWVDIWGNYIPVIFGVAKALMAMQDSDPEAKAAWDDRMQAVRHGCAAAIDSLQADGHLRAELARDDAVDVLWTLLSVRNWEQLRFDCGWSQDKYIKAMKDLTLRTLTTLG